MRLTRWICTDPLKWCPPRKVARNVRNKSYKGSSYVNDTSFVMYHVLLPVTLCLRANTYKFGVLGTG